MFYKYIVSFINKLYEKDAPLHIVSDTPYGVTYDPRHKDSNFEKVYATEIKGFIYHGDSIFYKQDVLWINLTYTQDHRLYDTLTIGTLRATLTVEFSNSSRFWNTTYLILRKVYKYLRRHVNINCWLILKGINIESFKYNN